jgi:hypothetical protein
MQCALNRVADAILRNTMPDGDAAAIITHASSGTALAEDKIFDFLSNPKFLEI